MKTRIFEVAVVVVSVTLALILGCAQVGPKMISPAVYSSSRDAVVEDNKLSKEKSTTGVKAQEQLRERSAARHQLVMEDLKKTLSNESVTPTTKFSADAINPNGMVGGFPSVVINDSACDAIVNVKKLNGDYAGVTWSFDLKSNGGDKELSLEADNYAIAWSFANSTVNHPVLGEGDPFMTVHNNPRFPYGRKQKTYYGAYRIKGSCCY